MQVHVIQHPLVNQKLTDIRDAKTSSADFKRLVHETGLLLGVEATRHLAITPVQISTPVAPTTGVALPEPMPLIVPILRAGLGFLEAFLTLMPQADVGFIGIKRDEHTLAATTYAERLPKDISGRHVFLIDPMLATGGSLLAAIEFLSSRGAARVTCVCLIASPEGVASVTEGIDAAGFSAVVELYLACIDEGLNTAGYIVPGLGDAGDRLYGLTD